MIKKMYLLAALIMAVISQSYAQYQNDALFFSQQFYGSTSKSMAMGGTLSAVGADLSVMATNPAGLALLRSNHFSFSSNFVLNSSENSYMDNTRNENSFGYSIGNLGFAWVIDSKSGEQRFVFGMAYNRLNDYRLDMISSGVNTTGSVLDYYVYNANNNRWSDFREDLAWETWLFNYDADLDEYYSFVTDEGIYGQRQRRTDNMYGGKGEFDMSMAYSYYDILSLGISVGTQFLNYEKVMRFTETDFDEVLRYDEASNPVRVDPANLEFKENYKTDGIGINFKAGLIIQPISYARVSLGVHSKTLTSLSEEYYTGMYSNFHTADDNGNFNYYEDSPRNVLTWNLHQPMRFNAGAAFVMGAEKIGNFYTLPMTLSFDYEYTDYSSMHLKSATVDFDKENDLIKDLYKETHSMRTGLELSLGQLSIRGGYALYPSPYKQDSDMFDNARMVYSGGVSFSGKAGYIDLSYSFSSLPHTTYMYDANIYFPNDPMGVKTEPTADVTQKFQFISLTFGLR